MDYLKELSIKLGGKIRRQHLSNWNLNGTSFRELIVKDYKGYKVEINDFREIYEIGVMVESDFSFSINLPNKIFNHNKPSTITDFPYKVYFSDDENDPVNPENIDFKDFWNPFINKIKEVGLSDNEGVFYYCNSVCLALNSSRD